MKSGQAGNVKQPMGLRNAGKKNRDEKSQNNGTKVENSIVCFDHRKVLEEETPRHQKVLLTVSSSITNSRKQRPCWRSRSPRSSCSERLMVQTHITSHTPAHAHLRWKPAEPQIPVNICCISPNSESRRKL